jgi:hypothetical protein
MMGAMGEGENGEVLELTPRLLVEIRDAVRATNARIDDLTLELRDGLRATNARVDDLTIEVRTGFDGMRGAMREGFEVLARGLDEASARIDETQSDVRSMAQIVGNGFQRTQQEIRRLWSRFEAGETKP